MPYAHSVPYAHFAPQDALPAPYDVRSAPPTTCAPRRPSPHSAPPVEQTYRAKKLYVRSGAGAWPHCGARLRG